MRTVDVKDLGSAILGIPSDEAFAKILSNLDAGVENVLFGCCQDHPDLTQHFISLSSAYHYNYINMLKQTTTNAEEFKGGKDDAFLIRLLCDWALKQAFSGMSATNAKKLFLAGVAEVKQGLRAKHEQEKARAQRLQSEFDSIFGSKPRDLDA